MTLVDAPTDDRADYPASAPVNRGRAALVQAMLDSPDYAKSVVGNLYQKLLHRAATPTELQSGLAAQAGGGEGAVMLAILTSDEYFNRAGGTTTAFLNRLSQDLMGKSGGKNSLPSKGDLLDLLRRKVK